MERFVLWMTIFLCLASVVTALAPIELVTESYEAESTPYGDIIVYEPQTPQAPGTLIPIGILIYFSGNPDLDIQLEGVQNLVANEFTNGTLENGSDYFQLEWVVVAEEGKSYNLSIRDNNNNEATALLKQITPDVRASFPVAEEVSPTESVTVQPAAIENIQNAWNTFFDVEETLELSEDVRVIKQRQYVNRSYSNGSSSVSTIVRLRLQPLVSDIEAYVIEEIPKTVVASTNDMVLDTRTIILEEDPVIMWRVSGSEPIEVSYEVPGEQAVTGNTVVVRPAQENQEERTGRTFLALLLIPLIGGIIFFFSRFEQKK